MTDAFNHASAFYTGFLRRLTTPSDAGERKARSLRGNFSWIFAGNVIYAATQWGILVLLARLGTPLAVGQFSLGLAITAPIMLLAGLQLSTVQATDAHRDLSFPHYMGLTIITTIAGVVVIIGISQVGYGGEMGLVIAAFGLSKGIESLSTLIYGLWLQQERMELIARSLIIRGLAALILSGILFVWLRTVWAAVCGIAVAWALVFVTHDLSYANTVVASIGESIFPSFNFSKMKGLFRLSIPLAIVTTLVSLNLTVPRYVIAHIRGIHELGIYTAVGYILVSGNLVVNSLGQSVTPRLAAFFSGERYKEFSRLTGRLIYIGAVLGVLGVLASFLMGRWALTLLYGREYGEHVRLLAWFMAAAGFSYMASFAWYSLTSARKFLVQVPLFAFVTLLTLVLCIVMVRANGLVGAAQALCAVRIVQLVATKWLLRRSVIANTNKSRPARTVPTGQEIPSENQSPAVSVVADHVSDSFASSDPCRRHP